MASEKILIVDDEPDIIRTTSLSLRYEGFRVITAADGQEALEKVAAEAPDLVILDIMLSRMNGDEVARALKKDEKYKRIPVILITALARKYDEDALNKIGADFYMKKPFDMDQLCNKIKEFLVSRKKKD